MSDVPIYGGAGEIPLAGVNRPRPKREFVEGSSAWLCAVVECRKLWRATHNDGRTVGGLEHFGLSNDDAVMVFKFAKDRGLLK